MGLEQQDMRMAYGESREQRSVDEQELEVVVTVAESNVADASCWDPEQRPGMVVVGILLGVEDEADILVETVGAAVAEDVLVAEGKVGRVDGMSEECARVVLL